MARPLLLLVLLALNLTSTAIAGRVKRQHNLYSVNDFLGQLGQLAALSQGQGGGGGPSNYLAGLLQAYLPNRPFQSYQPQRPVPPEYLQDLQYQQQYQQQQQQQQQGQGVLGFDSASGGFGLRPGTFGSGQQSVGAGVFGGFRPGQPGGGLGGGQGGAGGLAGLAALAGLGGFGGGGLGGGVYQRPGAFRPPGGLGGAVSLANALQSVARYDDAQCVPRLLCELSAGGRPGGAKQNDALPFVNRDTLVSLLTVLNFGTNSPLLVFGRAALLGYMAQGDPSSCYSAYPTCPRDPDRLVDYLNNHNGGFFRFFTGVGNPQYQQQLQYQQFQQYQQQLQYQGHRPNQYAPQFRDYEAHRAAGKVVFPRERSVQAESRILTKTHPIEAAPASLYRDPFLPTPRPSSSPDRAGRKRKLFKFPAAEEAVNAVVSSAEEAGYINGQPVPAQYLDGDTFTLGDGEYTFTNPYKLTATKEGHRVQSFSFPVIRVGSPAEVDEDNQDGGERPYIPNIRLQKPAAPVEIFPTRTGTGDLRLDPAEHLKLQGQHQDQGLAASRPHTKPFRFASDDEDNRYQGGYHDGYLSQDHRQGHAFRFPVRDEANGK